ncbi:ABC transporter substrate-binding protein [Pseudonocardia sp. GCM10023141]|uniref:ABC transporter substrate-binding protein n=1 Tax=Pseudonocardia sp. GCM10023141 TaxID=3252653 RepID=UPI0036152464
MSLSYSRRRVLALPAVALLAAACGAPVAPLSAAPAVGGPWAAPRGVPAGMGSPAADGVFPREVTHFGGTTQIPAAPRRVVVISTGQLDGLLALGVLPVGAARGDDAVLVPPYLATAFPQQAAGLVALADLGLRTAPNLEAIAKAAPDLILANKAGVEDLAPQLARIAPTVLTQGTGVNWKQDLLLVAHALGSAQHAQQLLDTFNADAAAVGTRTGTATTVSFLRITAGRIRVFGVPSFTGSIAQDAGLPRPSTQTFGATSQDISREELAKADGGHVFYGVQGGASDVLTSDVWKRMGAVAAGRATAVDDDVWYLNAGPVAARLVLDGLAATLG